MDSLQRKRPSPVIAPSPSFEQLLDSEEAAALLKIHPKTLQRMARQGQITAIQIGKLWRFRVSELDRWLSEKAAS
jgi:excisionase family DNA binding protein